MTQILEVPRLLSKSQLCARFGISRWTLNRWIDAGVFTVVAIVIQGRDFYPEPEVVAFLEAHRDSP